MLIPVGHAQARLLGLEVVRYASTCDACSPKLGLVRSSLRANDATRGPQFSFIGFDDDEQINKFEEAGDDEHGSHGM
eukprot:1735893-Karenia_brevis.AAC.1